MIVVPQIFILDEKMPKLMMDGLNCILYKKIKESIYNTERFVSCCAFSIVTKGELQIKNLDGDFIKVSAGNIAFLPKGIFFLSDIISEKEDFEATVLFMEENLILEFLKQQKHLPLKQIQEKAFHHFPYNDGVKIYRDSLIKMANAKALPDSMTRTKLLEFLHLMADSQEKDSFFSALLALKKSEKRDIKSFMTSHFHKPLNVEDYAYLTGRSLSAFQRSFKEIFQASPKQWLIEKRMDLASELLLKTDQVHDVAHEVGYDNTNHFIKAFSKKYGMTPKQYQLNRIKNQAI